jgi:hypothetical protein
MLLYVFHLHYYGLVLVSMGLQVLVDDVVGDVRGFVVTQLHHCPLLSQLQASRPVTLIAGSCFETVTSTPPQRRQRLWRRYGDCQGLE